MPRRCPAAWTTSESSPLPVMKRAGLRAGSFASARLGTMVPMDDDEVRWREAATFLGRVAKPMRVLSSISWPARERDVFLAYGASKVPSPTYAPVDPSPALDGVAQARHSLRPGSLVDDWLGAHPEVTLEDPGFFE